MTDAFGLKLVTTTPGGGYGDAALEYLRGLTDLGIPVTWQVVRDGHWGAPARRVDLPFDLRRNSARLASLFDRSIPHDTFLLCIPPPAWHLRWLQQEEHTTPFAGATWEADRLPASWPPVLNHFSTVVVPSEFNRSVFVASGVRVPVEVVPYCAREVQPVPGGPPWGRVADDDFVFYTLGSWTARKAIEETIRAYLGTFTGDDRVALIVKTGAIDWIAIKGMTVEERTEGPPHLGTSWWQLAQIVGEYENPAKIHLVADRLPLREIDRLHTRGDCFVSLTRGEGWGLGPFDAGLFGNPSIVTGWGGQLDFLGSDYPFLVDYELESTADSPANGYLDPPRQIRWAKPDVGQASRLMRRVFDERRQARELGAELGRRLRSRYRRQTVCRRLAEVMNLAVRQPEAR